jgi:hypothetical protein
MEMNKMIEEREQIKLCMGSTLGVCDTWKDEKNGWDCRACTWSMSENLDNDRFDRGTGCPIDRKDVKNLVMVVTKKKITVDMFEIKPFK